MSRNDIDNLKDKYFPVLDHGFCAVVDSMGDDHAIARAARNSYGVGTKTVSNDRSLIRTLMRDIHTSPFESCEIVLHMGLPLFIARQIIRHRTASVSEYSGRYSIMPMIFYDPTYDRHNMQSTINRQGSREAMHLANSQYDNIATGRHKVRKKIVEQYQNCLDADLTRELARIDLPLSTYTYWYWKIDLKNLLHFLRLRLDSHAQWEIQQYGRVIAGIVKQWLPITWEAFDDYVLNGVTFSRQEQGVLQYLLCNAQDFAWETAFTDVMNGTDTIEDEIISECHDAGMSLRETQGFLDKMKHMGGGQFTNDIDLDLSTAKPPEYYAQQIEEHSMGEKA